MHVAKPRPLLVTTGALALLGFWLLVRLITKGRTLWTFDRNSGQVLYCGKLLRSLSSITHLTIFAREAGGDITCYVELTSKQSSLVTKLLMLVGPALRKEILVFCKPKEALQAAIILATFLGVRIIGGEACGLKVILTGNGRDIERLDFQSGKPGDGFIFRHSEASGAEQAPMSPGQPKPGADDKPDAAGGFDWSNLNR
jgi:hypothetical protein